MIYSNLKFYFFKFYRKYFNKFIVCEGGFLVYGYFVYWM